MRAIEPWVEAPLATFLSESGARVALLMTSSGQVVAQHGFTRSLEVMSAAALGAGIMASTAELAKLVDRRGFGAVVHQGAKLSVYLAPFELPRGRWIGLIVFGPDTSVGMVQLFFGRLVADLARVSPAEPVREVLPESFEAELDSSLRALFGR
ncbi:MAG: roadblock/LC7 domain-containing protein [Gemmatimonadota bacterium]